MKLVSLYASNFKKLDFASPLKFKDGITVISGLNEAGKSTVLDAILYALYGRVIRPPGRVKDEDLLAYTTGRATIILEFSIGDKIYRVTRQIRRNGTNTATLALLLGEGHSKALATGGREVTASIVSLLDKISFDEMISSNIMAQKDLNRLVGAGADRWKVINAFLHLESFSSATEDLNEERKDLEGTGASRPGSINIQTKKLEQLRRDLDEYRRRLNQNEKLAEEDTTLSDETEALVTRYGELDSLHGQLMKYDDVSTRRQKILNEAAGTERLLQEHKNSIATIEAQIQKTEAQESKYRDLPQEAKIHGLQELLNGAGPISSLIENLGESVEKKKLEIQRVQLELKGYDQSDLQKTDGSRLPLRRYAAGSGIAFVAAIVGLILSLPVLPWILAGLGAILLVPLGFNVSRMGRLVRLQGLLAKFELLRGKREELKKLEDSLTEEQKKRADAITKVRKALGEIAYYDRIEGDKEPLERADLVVKEYQKDSEDERNAESNLRILRTSLENLTSQMDERSIRRQIDELNGQAAQVALPALPAGIEFSKDLLATTGKDKEGVSTKIAGNRSSISSNKRIIDENNVFLEEQNDIETSVTLQEEVLRELQHRLRVVVAAKAGIEKTAESRRVKFQPHVEFAMGEILPSLTSGRYKAVKLDDDFGVRVFDPEAGEYRPKDVFSGGTEDQFLLAMRLAFALALMPEVKGTTPQFLWLDEPLGSSDEVRRTGIIEYVKVNLSGLFSQIFIVSHVGGLEEQIPNVIRLENGRVSG